ncbi:phosphotransferase [Botrimarina sp.]|uniref:phosphotransferase n=1 Tax=Botrimarina sp. TaxID=2795802 RepID=UPI0032F05AC1
MADAPILPAFDAAAFCRQHYRLERAEVVGVLQGGMFAKPLLLRAGEGRFVLRRHTIRSTSEAFRFQAESIDAAARAGVACAEVVPATSGAWSVPAGDGSHVVALHRYVDGEVIDWPRWRERCEREPGFLESLGRAVGRLHTALAEARPAGDPELSVGAPPIRFDRLPEIRRHWERSVLTLLARGERDDEARAAILGSRARIDGHWDWLERQVARCEVASLPRQPVHGDVSAVNIVWAADGQPAFIDWDAAHVGWRLYDALGDILNRTPNGRPDQNRFRVDHVARYLAGYESALRSPLTQPEREAIPAFCLARQLEDLRQRVATLPTLPPANRRLYAELIAMRVDMMDQIAGAEFPLLQTA